MSYLVLARKWRPSTFDEVVGQGHVTRTLKNAIELGRVAHALLFTGSRGVGKTSCARILAKALNCEQGPTPSPCGTCPACAEINSGASVDVFEIDGASNNSVEQIREIRESVKFLPTKGKRKMYIIDEVHMLSTSAFNALLKTLEEPPAHVLFVFATTEPHKIPDTILSRCQRYDFKRISEREIVGALERIGQAEGLEVAQEAFHHIAREAQGGMRDSLSLLDQVIAFCGTTIDEAQTREVLGIADRGVLFELTGALFRGDANTALDVVDQLFRFGLDLKKFAGELVQHLRDLMVVKVCGDPARLVDVPASELATMGNLVQNIHPARIHRLFGAMIEGADSVNRSPYPKLVLEMTLLRLCHQGSTLPLGEVLDGLSKLEARLAAGGAVAQRAEANVPTEAVTPPPASRPQQVATSNPVPVESNTALPESTPSPESVMSPEPAADIVEKTASSPTVPPSPPAMEMPTPADEAPPWASATPSKFDPPVSEPEKTKPAPEPTVAKTPDKASSAPAANAAKKANVAKQAKPDPKPAEGPRTFKRRPSGSATDDFSAPPPTPRAPEKLPKLMVKPRAPGAAVPAMGTESADDADSEGSLAASTEPTPARGHETPPPAQSSPTAPSVQATADPAGDEPPTGTVTIEFDDTSSPTMRFAQLIGALRESDPFLASEIEQTVFLQTFDAQTLSLAASQRDYESVARGLPKLEATVKLVCPDGPLVELSAYPFDDERLSGETLYVRRRRLEKEERARRQEAAGADPTILLAAEALDATIIDIKPQ